MPRIRVTYTGRVQGVGFRATAASIANRFEITGWVRNEPDGTVTLEAQGDESELTAFRAALRSRMARNIQREQDTPIAEADDEPGFEVRRH